MAQAHAIPDFAAYVLTPDAAETAAAVARAGGWGADHLHRGGLSGAARLAGDAPLAQHVLAELGNEGLSAACESVAAVTRAGARLVVLGRPDDLRTYRALKAAGAADYFPLVDTQPANINDLLRAYAEAPMATAPQPVQKAQVIGVTGCNGGVGASALAQNLALLAGGPARVALIDADLRFAAAAHDLNQDTTVGILDALADPARVDRVFLEASMAQVQDHLWLYSHPARNGAEAARLEAGFAPLLRQIAPFFDLIIVDLPRNLLVMQPELAAALDRLVTVFAPGYAGLNGYVRLAQMCQDEHHALTLLPVLSQMRQDAALPVKEIEKAIARPLAATLPRDDRGMMRAHQLGRPLADVARRSRYAVAAKALLAQMQSPAPRPKSGLIAGLWRRAGA